MAEHRKQSESSKSMTGMGASGRLQQAAETVREELPETYGQAAEWAEEYASEMSHYVQRQMRVMRRYFDENPMMLGVVGLGLGLLAGALIPVTRAERRFLRPLGRELREGAGETLRQVRRRVDDLADEAEEDEAATTASTRASGASRHPTSRSRH